MWSFFFPSARAWLRALRLAVPVYAGTIALWFSGWYLSLMSLVSLTLGANLGDLTRLLTLAGIAAIASALWWSLMILLYGLFLQQVWRSPPAFLTLPRPLRRTVYHFALGVVATLPLAVIRIVQLLQAVPPPQVSQWVILRTAIAAFPDFVVPYFWVWWIVAAYGYHWVLLPQARTPPDAGSPPSTATAGTPPTYTPDVEYELEALRRELEGQNRDPVPADPPGAAPAADAAGAAASASAQSSTPTTDSNPNMLIMLGVSLIVGLGALYVAATVLLLPFPDVNLPLPGLARYATATVVSVSDGDTLTVEMAGDRFTVRLACIDAPERSQPGGTAATDFLRQRLPTGQSLGLRRVAVDRYGRTVAELYQDGASVNVALVRAGHAVVYPRYLDDCPGSRADLLAAEAEARAARRNFWSQPKPQMPWRWRQRHQRTAQPPTTAQARVTRAGWGDR